MTEAYYDELAPLYHLIYPDWAQHAAQQVAALDSLIRETWPQTHTLLDAACGIGTQALGLAECGYQVAASDISAGAVARLEREAAARNLVLHVQVADMRAVAQVWPHPFDMVIACDNAIPHLLSDEDILTALRAFLCCTRPGGGCILSVRDYAQVAREDGTRLVPRGVLGMLALGFTMQTFTDAALPYADAFTTVMSLIAQWLLARKKLENWGFWIAVDVVAIGVYLSRDLYFTTGLYTLFLGMAIAGLVAWWRAWQADAATMQEVPA